MAQHSHSHRPSWFGQVLLHIDLRGKGDTHPVEGYNPLVANSRNPGGSVEDLEAVESLLDCSWE